MKLDPTAARLELARKGEQTLRESWRIASLARRRAIYIAVTAANIPQRAVARATGLTPPAICLACQAVEQERDDPAIDALLDAAAAGIVIDTDQARVPLQELLQRYRDAEIGVGP